MARNVKIYLGHGREVVAHGTLVLSGGDLVATVALDDLIFHFRFEESPEVPRARTTVTGNKITTFTITGVLPSGGTTWWWEDAGTYEGGKLSLGIEAQRYSSNPLFPATHRLLYTFSTSPRHMAGLLGQ